MLKTTKGRGRGRGIPQTQFPKAIHGTSQELATKGAEVSTPEKPNKKYENIQRHKFEQEEKQAAGTSGRPIALLANYFMLTYKDVCIYHYDVDICEVDKNQEVGKSLMKEGLTAKQASDLNIEHVQHQQRRSIGLERCRAIISEMTHSTELRHYSPVYDGQKNIYTCKPLPFQGEKRFKVSLNVNGREKTYCVILQPVQKDDKSNSISLKPLREMYAGHSKEVPNDILMVFDTVMAHREPPLSQVRARNSFFFLNQRKSLNLGSGLEVWFGYNQSVHFTERGPAIVINLSAKAFYKEGPVIEYANEILRCDIRTLSKLGEEQIKKLSDALANILVQVTHQPYPRKYRVGEVSRLAAKEDWFTDFNNKKISVAQYFSEKYVTLKYPQLPCLVTQHGAKLPFENCVIVPGQPKTGKLDPFLSSKMIRETAIAPEERFKTIVDDSKIVANFSKKPMEDFGLFMDTKLMELNGRVIASPVLSYNCIEQSQHVRPDTRGVWRMDGKRFFKPQKIERWILISFARVPEMVLKRFATCLSNSGAKLGLKLGQNEIKICTQRDNTRDVLVYAKNRADLAVIVLSRMDPHHKYAEVKFIADFQLNLITQCMEDKVVQRVNDKNDQITNNICLKLNLKLGGMNHILLQSPQVFRDPCIVMGADVIHCNDGYPSIAAVVGSLDPFHSTYALTCCIQKNKDGKKISQEIIYEMKDIAKGILLKFVESICQQPMRIIFFRDGVSEGQFAKAGEIEVGALQEACQELFNSTVRITYVIVQKRHQTRLKPKYQRDGVGKMCNIPAGTVVDTDIVHPVYNDYFLCSHEGIQGTSKPAHYTKLHDDNYLTLEEMQQLSYHMCHMYGRCNRSVSIPAPVFYADLACARAKNYADLHIEPMRKRKREDGPAMQKEFPSDVVAAINAMKSFPNNMFYI